MPSYIVTWYIHVYTLLWSSPKSLSKWQKRVIDSISSLVLPLHAPPSYIIWKKPRSSLRGTVFNFLCWLRSKKISIHEWHDLKAGLCNPIAFTVVPGVKLTLTSLSPWSLWDKTKAHLFGIITFMLILIPSVKVSCGIRTNVIIGLANTVAGVSRDEIQ